jgi:hypothetical protein
LDILNLKLKFFLEPARYNYEEIEIISTFFPRARYLILAQVTKYPFLKIDFSEYIEKLFTEITDSEEHFYCYLEKKKKNLGFLEKKTNIFFTFKNIGSQNEDDIIYISMKTREKKSNKYIFKVDIP